MSMVWYNTKILWKNGSLIAFDLDCCCTPTITCGHICGGCCFATGQTFKATFTLTRDDSVAIPAPWNTEVIITFSFPDEGCDAILIVGDYAYSLVIGGWNNSFGWVIGGQNSADPFNRPSFSAGGGGSSVDPPDIVGDCCGVEEADYPANYQDSDGNNHASTLHLRIEVLGSGCCNSGTELEPNCTVGDANCAEGTCLGI